MRAVVVAAAWEISQVDSWAVSEAVERAAEALVVRDLLSDTHFAYLTLPMDKAGIDFDTFVLRERRQPTLRHETGPNS